MKDLCFTSDFDAPWPPRLDRCEVVHDESHLRVLVNVTPLLPLGKVITRWTATEGSPKPASFLVQQPRRVTDDRKVRHRLSSGRNRWW
jgi:hypothetical protein